MQFIIRSLPRTRRRPHHHHQSRRTVADLAASNWVRDRGLDHTVEKESNLRPVLNLKNFIKSEPSKSIPLSIIANNRESLGLPFRPIDFIRNYPSVFEEFLPGGTGIHPHVKLTSDIIEIDAEEQLIYQTENHKQQVANRLLKLLMIGKVNKIPLQIIDSLKWDLGLPQDYIKTIVPEFPDYFRVKNGHDSSLELVCWSNDLAVSVMEKKAMNNGDLTFPLSHSRGFEMDKKYKKWVDDWQKLPYVSPYENASHLQPKSDAADKWAVAVMHELLHLFVPKKTEKENMLHLGEYFGLRSRFKRALLNHPGIFYVSSKIGTHTVVLKEAYKRDLLIENHPLMGMRYKYVHLMNMVKEGHKPKSAQSGRQQKRSNDSKGGEEGENHESIEEQDEKFRDLSDSEFEDDSEDDDYEESEDNSDTIAHKSAAISRGRTNRNNDFEEKRPSRNMPRRSSGENPRENPPKFSKREEVCGGQDIRGRSRERSDVPGSLPKFSKREEFRGGQDVSGRFRGRSDVYGSLPKFSERVEVRGGQDYSGRSRGRSNVPGSLPKFSKRDEVRGGRDFSGRSRGRSDVPGSLPKFSKRDEVRGGQEFGGRSDVPGSSSKFLKRTEVRGGQDVRGRSRGRSDVLRTRERPNPDRRASA